jgi:hypothetical protein
MGDGAEALALHERVAAVRALPTRGAGAIAEAHRQSAQLTLAGHQGFSVPARR